MSLSILEGILCQVYSVLGHDMTAFSIVHSEIFASWHANRE